MTDQEGKPAGWGGARALRREENRDAEWVPPTGSSGTSSELQSQRVLRSRTNTRPLSLPSEEAVRSPPDCQAEGAVPPSSNESPVIADTSDTQAVNRRRKPRREVWYMRKMIKKQWQLLGEKYSFLAEAKDIMNTIQYSNVQMYCNVVYTCVCTVTD